MTGTSYNIIFILLLTVVGGAFLVEGFKRLLYWVSGVADDPARPQVSPSVIGMFERTLAFGLAYAHVDNYETILAGWLGAKLALYWKRMRGDVASTRGIIALMLGTTSVSLGVLGGRAARESWPIVDWLAGLDMTFSGWTGVLVGFAGGSVAAVGIQELLTYLRRPILRADLVRGGGCYVVAGLASGEEASFLRLRVRNVGRSAVRSCAAYLTQITRSHAGAKEIEEREVLELKWAHGDAEARDLPREAFFYVDIAALNRTRSTLHFLPQTLPSSMPWLSPAPEGSYTLRILVAASNADPVEREITFTYDRGRSDLAFSFDDG